MFLQWWTTTDEDGQELAPSGFDFSQLEWQGTEDSIAMQRVGTPVHFLYRLTLAM